MKAMDRFNQLRSERTSVDERSREKQAARGKRSALDRVLALVDEGTFTEIGGFVRHRVPDFGMDASRPLTDGIVTGFGEVDGRPVAVFSQDFSIFGGSLGEGYARKLARLMDLAVQNGCPVIGINDAGGARIQEGVEGLAGYGDIFFRNIRASGVVPQISIIAGPCAGGAVYSPAITDFIIMVDEIGQMFITGPDVIKTVTGETVSREDLGGVHTHTARSGVAHFRVPNEDELNDLVRDLLSHLPSNNLTDPPTLPAEDDPERLCNELATLMPEQSSRPYDMHAVLADVLDDGDLLEVQAEYAPNIIVGYGRLAGHTVGVIANQPAALAGTLDIDASTKAARFVRTCDAFNIPLVTFVDVPGFLPGTDQEYGGIIRHGAKLLYAYGEASVPKLTVITRKAYGGAYVVMCSKHIGADFVAAWPMAEIAVMGAEAAVNIVFRRELEASAEPAARRAELMASYQDLFASPYQAAERGYVDDVIDPTETRRWLIRTLALSRTKRDVLPRRKHGNIPL